MTFPLQYIKLVHCFSVFEFYLNLNIFSPLVLITSHITSESEENS